MAATTKAPAFLYADEVDLEQFLSVDGVAGRAIDDTLGGLPLDDDQESYVERALTWGTTKVNFYCLSSYDAVDLAASQIVCEWATICSAKWMSSRRGNPPPETVDDLYDEAIAEMKMVQAGQPIADAAARVGAFPAWSNIRFDDRYPLRKLRVERPISEKSVPGSGYIQSRDIGADYLREPN